MRLVLYISRIEACTPIMKDESEIIVISKYKGE
jgi:hypothetical protein